MLYMTKKAFYNILSKSLFTAESTIFLWQILGLTLNYSLLS